MNSECLVQADVDLARNILRTRYIGRPSVADMEQGTAKIRAAILQMKPGFKILADWSQIEAMELGHVPYITEVMDLARTSSASMIVRVLPDPDKDIGINILSALHLRGTARTVTAETHQEAERLLA